MTIGIWGAGFIGRGVLNALINRGVRDLCVLTRGGEASIEVASVKIPVRRLPFESSSEEMSSALAGLSVLIHCSGSPRDEFESYLAATKRMAKVAARLGIKRVVYISTVAVYGDAVPNFGIGEAVTIGTDTFPKPKSIYAKSRFNAECEMRGVFEKSNVDFVTVRIPMVIGVGMGSNIFERLRKLLDFRIRPELGKLNTILPCIGIEHLSNLLAKISLEEASLGGVYQFSESKSWQSIILLCDSNKMAFRLAIPINKLYKALLFLGFDKLTASIRPMLNTVSYADDSKLFIRESDRAWSLDQCFLNVIENIRSK